MWYLLQLRQWGRVEPNRRGARSKLRQAQRQEDRGLENRNQGLRSKEEFSLGTAAEADDQQGLRSPSAAL